MRELKATDKITQKMTRDGAVSENLATGEVEHISSREPETELSASSEESAGAAAENIGKCGLPAPGLSNFPLYRHDREWHLRRLLPLWKGR